MDQRGAGTPWHEIEGVAAGQEKVPGLLRGLLTPGLWDSSWAQLEELVGWHSDEPLFLEVTQRLFELLPLLDPQRRALVLGLLARRAHGIGERRVGVHRRAFLAFAAREHEVVQLVADPSAQVRAAAAWLLRGLRGSDPAALEALRGQASRESDPTALVSQLLAVGALSGSGDQAVAGWVRPWLDHADPLVRLAAARAVLLTAAPGGSTGTGHRIAGAFCELGTGSLPQVPWWPAAYTPVERYTDQLAAHPREAEALVEVLARQPDPDLRVEAVRAAGKQLHYWRSPSAHLWETLAAGLEDEDRVAGAAVEVLAGIGAAAAPYADRIFGLVDRAHATGWTRHPAAMRALVHIEDRRALSPCMDHFAAGHYLEAPALPVRWASYVLPAFRERLAYGAEARDVPTVLRILTRWGPAAAPAAPELADLLDTASARPAAEALGRIGPAASAAAGELAALARGETSPWRFGVGTERSPKPWHGAQTAAWAHWRVTGDPELALRVCGAAARAGLGRPVLRHLADLGPLAAPYADSVRALLDCPGEWSRVGAAEAWWRITGDPAPAVAALLPELAPAAGHRVTELMLRTVRALGAIGPPAAAALPVLRTVAAGPPRRYGESFLMDEELLRDARAALDRISGS